MTEMEHIRQAIVRAGFRHSGDRGRVLDSFLIETDSGEIFDLWLTTIVSDSDYGIIEVGMEMWKESDRLETGTAKGSYIYSLSTRVNQIVEQWIQDHINENQRRRTS